MVHRRVPTGKERVNEEQEKTDYPLFLIAIIVVSLGFFVFVGVEAADSL